MHFKYILVYLLFTKVLNLTFDQICMIFFVKAAVRNIYLFVALYVWKPGIEVSCRIIFRRRFWSGLWSGVPARLQRGLI